MSILSGNIIESYCKKFNMITPFEEEQVNPASYDIRVGETYMYENHELKKLNGGILLVNPGDFVLVSSLEQFNLPHNVCGQFGLKSTAARSGFQHLLAGFCDPGWNGSVLTMEIRNASVATILKLETGMRIGQMVFSFIDADVNEYEKYQGKYNGDSTVSGPKVDDYIYGSMIKEI